MSAPVRMTPQEVSNLGAFLQALSKATREYGVSVCAFGPIPLLIGTNSYLSINWHDEYPSEYVIDDRAGD